tara:strand:+ start:47 stop:286 length:240 start_codon:yes stop_codon:yes gene_type:complete
LIESSEFCKKIENLILNDTFDNYIEAVLHVCDKEGMEPFMGARLLSQPIKEKIKEEGQSINLLPSKTKLPLKNKTIDFI